MRQRKKIVGLIVSLWLHAAVASGPESNPPAHHFDFSHWKLTLPVSAPGTAHGKPHEIRAAQLTAGYSDARYFHSGTNGEMILWCPVTGVTTKNSDYPRTELRETLAPTDDSVCWTATGEHVLSVSCRVSEVPSTCKVIVGQIHSYSGRARPLVKLQFFKGRIEALVKESPAKGKDLKLTLGYVGLDQNFDYEIKLRDGQLSVSVNGAVQSVNVFEKDPAWQQSSFYFKAGAYVQDNQGPDSEGARVAIGRLVVSHSGVGSGVQADPPGIPPALTKTHIGN